jgi:nitrate reductase cytochrome c-type subunit
MITIDNYQVTTDTNEEFEAWDIEAGANHQAYMIALGYSDYWCERLMGTPEPNEQERYVANFSAYPWVL